MDDNNGGRKTVAGKSLRPVRNRRYSRFVPSTCGFRKSFTVGSRPAKRLFTPEIKRFLKEWLIRRRDNPYPNRDEKKLLAVETGLTYIQICNWFANWRRKLKNVGKEQNRKTWGHLIKTYNNHAHGNVEQFSICSDDSIWGETEARSPDTCLDADDYAESVYKNNYQIDYTLSKLTFSNGQLGKCNKYNDQCYQVSSTTEDIRNDQPLALGNISVSKYKNHIMEKYLKGLQDDREEKHNLNEADKESEQNSKPVLLSKWLESAAKFQPQKSNYVSWNLGSKNKDKRQKAKCGNPDNSSVQRLGDKVPNTQTCNNDLNSFTKIPDFNEDGALPTDHSTHTHGREEVEAAEALTRLAGLYKS